MVMVIGVAAADGNDETATVTDDDTTEAKEETEAVLEDVVLPEVFQQLTARTTEVITSRFDTITSGFPGAPSPSAWTRFSLIRWPRSMASRNT